MPRPPGTPKTGGRKAGTPNKITATVRETFEQVFTALQSHDTAKLQAWAERNPTEFYKLSSKLIPSDVNATVNGAVSVMVVTGVPTDESDEPADDASDLV